MIRVRQIKVEVLNDSIDNLKKAISKKLNISINDIQTLKIHKQSLDARNKNEIYYVYEVDIETPNDSLILKSKNKDIFLTPNEDYIFPHPGHKRLNHQPVIIGSGPAGLFAAYVLAENHYNPIIIERGEPVEERISTVDKFWKTGIINPNSNVQFGEGGAGTFSDGKLNTLVKDEGNRIRKIYETFVKFGAPEEILYSYKPHIGTDILSSVVKNMRNAIIKMGGSFLYNSCLTNFKTKDGHLTEIEINHEKIIPCDKLILAIGHSARDTFKMLFENNVIMNAKPFAVGIRVSHSQEMINNSQYGKKYAKYLPPATYKLTYKSTSGRGVYSFCMCPGGYVVNASSEEGHLAVNGMSYHKRDSKNANSAIVVTIPTDLYNPGPLGGIAYQQDLEKKAFINGSGQIPIQLLKDFKNNEISKSFGELEPVFKGNYQFSNLNNILPDIIVKDLLESFENFGKKIKGFDNDDTILAAIESRTSSPVRIYRDEFYESNIKGVMPCGEGAGYAGGITSAALDGLKVAEMLGSSYQNNLK